jgi:hypothetical protein
VLDHLIVAIFCKQCIIGFVDMVVTCILMTCWMIEKFLLNGIVLLCFRNIGLYGGHMYIVDLLDD